MLLLMFAQTEEPPPARAKVIDGRARSKAGAFARSIFRRRPGTGSVAAESSLPPSGKRGRCIYYRAYRVYGKYDHGMPRVILPKRVGPDVDE